ncbi:CCHC-type domain-containing protein [Plasmodiophora brassicae]
MDAPKILVLGTVTATAPLYRRLQKLHAKQKFDAAFCVGTFPVEEAVATPAPLPVYYLLPANDPMPDASSIAANVTVLHGHGQVDVGPLRVGYLAGVFHGEPPGYTPGDVAALEALGACDLLLTQDWPRGFHTLLPDDRIPGSLRHKTDATGSYLVAQLAMRLRPRYHFAGVPSAHCELPPYRNDQDSSSFTRFIALAEQGSDQKSLYACVIGPAPSAPPADVTPCPYTATRTEPSSRPAKRPKTTTSMAKLAPVEVAQTRWAMGPQSGQPPPPGYVCRLCSVAGHYIEDCPQASTPPDGYVCNRCHQPGHFISACSMKRASREPQECWFCLASPSVEAHLIVNIGPAMYVALARGPLNDSHALIIPISHVRSSRELSPDERSDLDKYKEALKTMFNGNCVIYERFIATRAATHMQVQVVPVDAAFDSRAFRDLCARESGVDFEVVDDKFTVDRIASDSQFIFVEAPGERMLFHMEPGDRRRVPLQVVRQALAVMAGEPAKADWNMCRLSVDEETAQRDRFKAQFAPFDPFPE